VSHRRLRAFRAVFFAWFILQSRRRRGQRRQQRVAARRGASARSAAPLLPVRFPVLIYDVFFALCRQMLHGHLRYTISSFSMSQDNDFPSRISNRDRRQHLLSSYIEIAFWKYHF
jgi:hypothetical protein